MGLHNSSLTVGVALGGPLAGLAADTIAPAWGFIAVGGVGTLIALAVIPAELLHRRSRLQEAAGLAVTEPARPELALAEPARTQPARTEPGLAVPAQAADDRPVADDRSFADGALESGAAGPAEVFPSPAGRS
jgi:hypothetical protein